jgi:hypothetical protein
MGWGIAVRTEKILTTVLHEAHERQAAEPMYTFSEARVVSALCLLRTARCSGYRHPSRLEVLPKLL